MIFPFIHFVTNQVAMGVFDKIVAPDGMFLFDAFFFVVCFGTAPPNKASIVIGSCLE